MSAHDAVNSPAAVRKVIYLTFPAAISNEPIVCNLVRQHDLCFSILQASITHRKEGFMILEVMGRDEDFRQGMDYLRQRGVKVTSPAQKIARDAESCTHCGMCTAMCLPGALFLDRSTRQVVYDADKCTACGLCTRVCPVRCMTVDTENGILG